MAMRKIRCRIRPEKTGAFSAPSTCASRRNTTATASTQLTHWHRNVAHATPATPIRNVVTNRMSTKMLDSDEHARNQNGVFESPRAEKMPVATL